MRSSPIPALLRFLILIQLAIQLLAIASDSECREKCGRIEIRYPFGITQGCSLSGFQLDCTAAVNSPSLFLLNSTTKILSISNGRVVIDSTPFTAVDCADGTHSAAYIALPETGPFTVSHTHNTFMAVGCDTVAVISDGGMFTRGCVSLCSTKKGAVDDLSGSCSGEGCCETSVPENMKYLALGATNMYGYKNTSRFGNCSYAFVVERRSFSTAGKELAGIFRRRMVLDWTVRAGDGCKNQTISSCGVNSECFDTHLRNGYLCNCSVGFSGNPYLTGKYGCRDIDECEPESNQNQCVKTARCENTVPGYECRCPFGWKGDGKRTGSGCRKIVPISETVVGIGLGFLLILIFAVWFYSLLKKRSLVKLQEHYFKQNGGWLLKQQLLSSHDSVRLFTADELRRSTENYVDSRIIGSGGYGTVYRGSLTDGSTVAIKKSKIMDQTQIDQFINEVVILTQINHRNVVKLLGCCLETEVPLLVYEYVSNGTLFHHIHEKRTMKWDQRLRSAAETAEALAYLHSSASTPIIHRDVKSSNILLDESYTAKVSDFGISRLIPMDQTHVPTLVQGTLGYLDPEYFQTGQLTAKSDVYSFGVVLAEILTGQRPVSSESNLAMYFLSSMEKKEMTELVDGDVVFDEDGVVAEQMKVVAELTKKCLLLRGEKRPTMKEVAQDLGAAIDIAVGNMTTELEEEDDGGDVGVLRKRKEFLGVLESQESLVGNLTADVDLIR
ncbi:putative Kinase [Zostera marina]|uniref:Putative Kinase n=1 Tax=Zostera marina TaxID=29655 RepID=A0A0K9Q3K9_ZOSMR|nr:putative Kinase [Zostera marina]